MKKLVTAIVLMGLAAFPGAAAARNVDGTWAPADGDVIRFEVLRQDRVREVEALGIVTRTKRHLNAVVAD